MERRIKMSPMITFALETIIIAFTIGVTLIVLAVIVKVTVRGLKYFLKKNRNNYRKFKLW